VTLLGGLITTVGVVLFAVPTLYAALATPRPPTVAPAGGAVRHSGPGEGDPRLPNDASEEEQ
jgi:hypothetical protein